MSDDARQRGDARGAGDGGAAPGEPGGGELVDEPDADELIGAVLDDRFRLDELLGVGGMGRVYRARQLSVDRDVAVKVLHGELSLQDELRERFFREAKVVSGFKHANIVRLIDFGQNDEHNLLYLVMELVDGLELEQLLDLGRVRPQLAFQIAYQVCGALVEAHNEGIIHRDLKADNLVLVPVSDGSVEVKVLDFGIALPQEANERLTQTGRIYGTPQYMAPEQAQGLEVDGRTDLFSLGAILFEMFVGHLPTGGSNSIEILLNRVQEGVPRLSEALPDGVLPKPAVDFVESLASKAPDQRPDDARAAREEIRQIRQECGWHPVTVDLSLDHEQMFEPWIVEDDDLDVPLAEEGAGGAGGSIGAAAPETASASSRGGTASRGSADAAGGSTSTSEDASSAQERTNRASAAAQASASGPAEGSASPSTSGGSSPSSPAAEKSVASKSETGSPPSTSGDDGQASVSSSSGNTRGGDASASPTGGGGSTDQSGGSTGSRGAPSNQSGGSTGGGGATGGAASPGGAGGGSDDGGGGGIPLLGIGCVGTLVVLVAAVAAVAFAAPGYLETLGLGGLLGGGGGQQSEDAAGYTSDPVCDKVDQADLPSGWTGSYTSQKDEDHTFEFGEDKLDFTWKMGRVEDEATLWLAQTSRDGRELSIECARVVTSDGEEECSGSMSRRGPILNISLDGAEKCEEKISGSWGAN